MAMRGSRQTVKHWRLRTRRYTPAGCAKIYGEKVSDAKTDRAELSKLRLGPGGAQHGHRRNGKCETGSDR